MISPGSPCSLARALWSPPSPSINYTAQAICTYHGRDDTMSLTLLLSSRNVDNTGNAPAEVTIQPYNRDLSPADPITFMTTDYVVTGGGGQEFSHMPWRGASGTVKWNAGTPQESGADLSLGSAMSGALGVFPIALAFGSLALLFSAMMRQRGAVIGAAFGVMFLMYLLDIVGKIAPNYEWVRWASAFRFYGSPIVDGISWGNVAVLLASALLLLTVMIPIFDRKDIYTWSPLKLSRSEKVRHVRVRLSGTSYSDIDVTVRRPENTFAPRDPDLRPDQNLRHQPGYPQHQYSGRAR